MRFYNTKSQVTNR